MWLLSVPEFVRLPWRPPGACQVWSMAPFSSTRGLELPAPSPGEGRGTGDWVQSPVANDLIIGASVMKLPYKCEQWDSGSFWVGNIVVLGRWWTHGRGAPTLTPTSSLFSSACLIFGHSCVVSLIMWGRTKYSSTFKCLSVWSNNQVDMRQISKRKNKLNMYICRGTRHTRESLRQHVCERFRGRKGAWI